MGCWARQLAGRFLGDDFFDVDETDTGRVSSKLAPKEVLPPLVKKDVQLIVPSHRKDPRLIIPAHEKPWIIVSKNERPKLIARDGIGVCPQCRAVGAIDDECRYCLRPDSTPEERAHVVIGVANTLNPNARFNLRGPDGLVHRAARMWYDDEKLINIKCDADRIPVDWTLAKLTCFGCMS